VSKDIKFIDSYKNTVNINIKCLYPENGYLITDTKSCPQKYKKHQQKVQKYIIK